MTQDLDARRLALVAVIALACGAAAPAAILTKLESQSFDTAASAASAGWTGLNNQTVVQNYGFSNTNNAGGVAGEAGGSMRMESARTYYADTNLLGTLDLTTRIEARGKIDIVNSVTAASQVFIAHFHTTPTNNVNVLGFKVTDFNSNPSFVRFQPWLFYSNAGNDNGPAVVIPNTVTDWEYVYDPDPDNNPITTTGLLTVRFFDGPNTYVSSTPTTLLLTASFNAFGLRTDALGGFEAQNPLQFFIDDVQYTAIPEPASAALVGAAAIAIARRRLARS